MEEIIGFTLVGLLVLAFGVGIKKLFTKKRDAFQYEDEIILDNVQGDFITGVGHSLQFVKNNGFTTALNHATGGDVLIDGKPGYEAHLRFISYEPFINEFENLKLYYDY